MFVQRKFYAIRYMKNGPEVLYFYTSLIFINAMCMVFELAILLLVK